MTAQNSEVGSEVSRRKLLAAAGIAGAALTAGSVVDADAAQTIPDLHQSLDPVATPPVAGLHLQFGSDASSEMVVSWHTLQPVHNPRVVLGGLMASSNKW